MINFSNSTFCWKSNPWAEDRHYRYAGGFVGTYGQTYHVRFNLEALCTVCDDTTNHTTEIFVSAPCRTEYTIATRNLFQVPSSEFRYAFSRHNRLQIAKRASYEKEIVTVARLDEVHSEHNIDLRNYSNATELDTERTIIEATLANDKLNAVSTFHDSARALTISVQYPVNLINLNVADQEFQVCTGPIVLPDLSTWNGREVSRVFLAHASFSHFDHVEFILQSEVEAANAERIWLDAPRGRDRYELLDAAALPDDYPPRRPNPTIYNETWALPATNKILRAANQ